MSEHTSPPILVESPAPTFTRAAVAHAEPAVMNGANWFWWITGLSLLNSILIHSGSDITLAIGLGVTLVADATFKDHLIVAALFDAIVLLMIFGLGFFARQGHFWAFAVGIVLYAGDALIYVLMEGWIGVAIHAYALFAMIRGAARLRAALKAAREPLPVVAPAPVIGA